jgi:hypothetical protein
MGWGGRSWRWQPMPSRPDRGRDGVLRPGVTSLDSPPKPEARPTHLLCPGLDRFSEGSGIMKRLVALLLLTLLALVAAAPSALAAKPTHERVAVDDVVVDELCGFPVKVHTTGVVLAIEWVDEDGSLRRFEAYPQFRSTYTNLDTGKSIKVNIAGPAHITEGRTAASPWLARATGGGIPSPAPMSRDTS